ncbi:MAG: TonB-dependent receptor plug domain-containing protein [Bacteroidota bacterium]
MKTLNFNTFKKGAVICALFCASPSIAQTVEPIMGAEIKAGKLNIAADDLGSNITILSRKDIANIPVQTTAELLGYIEGLDLRQRGPNGVQADIQIQGGTFDQVLVLIDGVRLTDPQTGHHMLNLMVPPEAIERIEIIKGAAARRYGMNALSGVVNIVTLKTANPGVYATGYTGSGFNKDTTTQNTYNNKGLRLMAGLQGNGIQGWVSAGYDQGNGYRHNTDFRTFRSSVKLSSIPTKETDVQLYFLGGIIHNAFGANGFYAAPADKNSFETVNTQLGSVGAIKKLKTGQLEAKINARYNNDHYVFVRTNPALYQNFHNSTTFMPEITYNVSGEFWQMALGVEARKEWMESSNLGNHDRTFYGNYVDIATTPLRGVKVNFGMYRLYSKETGQIFYPGADILVALLRHKQLGRPKFNFFASWGTGQRLPTFTDLYYSGPSNLGNPNLLPESARTIEMGLRKTGRKIHAQAGIFRRTQQQMIDRIKDSLTSPWQPVNLMGDNFLIEGFECRVMGSKNINYASPFEKLGLLSVRWTLGATQLRQLSFDALMKGYSQYAVNFLPKQYMASLNLQTKYGVQLTTQYRYSQRSATGFDAGSGYSMLDMRLVYGIKRKILIAPMTYLPDETPAPIKWPYQYSIWVNAQNLLNTQYKEIASVPLMPRWITFGITVTPPPAATTPREVQIISK